MKTISVPNKLSDLLEIVIQDMNEAYDSPDITIDMSSYYQKRQGVCYVCLGGCLLTGTLKIQDCLFSDNFKWRYEINSEWKNIIYGLDNVRMGNYYGAHDIHNIFSILYEYGYIGRLSAYRNSDHCIFMQGLEDMRLWVLEKESQLTETIQR